jgi:hypothetical protein
MNRVGCAPLDIIGWLSSAGRLFRGLRDRLAVETQRQCKEGGASAISSSLVGSLKFL